MGESSITLTQAMRLGKACIVTNDASFRELPDTAVVKINVGVTEISDLAEAISSLAQDGGKRATLGRAAKAYTRTALDPSLIAAQFCDALETDAQQRAKEALSSDASEPGGEQLALRLLEASLEARLPQHLRLTKRSFPGQ